MLEIDYRDVTALSMMGVTYHLLGDVETAIVKYHEVCSSTSPTPLAIINAS